MKYKKTTLPNGVRVITIPMADNPTVTFMMYAGTGNLYEDAGKSGISHFLEHMCFKGTEKRPSPRAISLELDSIGAVYNAYTWLEKTCYHAKAGSEHLAKIADVVSDIYLNSQFSQDEMRKEKGVVCGEIDMYNDDPQSKVDELLTKAMYKGTPAERTTLGSKKTVNAISQKDLIEYRNRQYRAGNTVIVVAGGVPEGEMLALAKKIGSKVKKGPWSRQKSTKEKQQKKPEMTVFKKDTDQAHLIVSFRTFDRFDKDIYIAQMIANILRSGMSSRLFVRLREEMGSGYYVSASHYGFNDFGQFTISTGTKPDRVPEIVSAILDEVSKLKTELVKDSELEKVREIIRSRTKMGLESSDDVAAFFGDQEIAGKEIHTPEERIKIMTSINAKDILRVAKRIFTSNKLNFAVVGPIEKSKVLEQALTFKA